MDKVHQVPEIEEVLIVTNDRFFTHFQDWHTSTRQKSSVKIVNDGTKSNEDRLGALGDVEFALKNHKINEDTLLIAGDNLFDFSLKDMEKEFKKGQANIVAVYDIKEKSKAAKRFGVVTKDENGAIIDFEEKPEVPKTSLVATACYMLTKKSMGRIPEYRAASKKKDSPGDFIQWLIQNEPVHTFTFSGHWFDIGSIEALEEARKVYEAQ